MPMNSLLARPAAIFAIAGPVPGAGSLANLLSNRTGLVFRTSAAAANSVHDFFLQTSAIGGAILDTIDAVAVLWSNLRPEDTISVTGTNLDAWNDTSSYGFAHYPTETKGAWAFSATRATSSGTKSVHTGVSFGIPGTPMRGIRVRITVGPTAHPSGYIQIGRLWLGKKLDFAVDYSSLELVEDDRSLVEQSDYGEDMEDVRRISFGWRVRWQFGSEAEMIAQHQRLVMLGKATPILFCPMPTASNAQDLLAFGKMRNPAKTASSAYDIWELGFDVFSEAA